MRGTRAVPDYEFKVLQETHSLLAGLQVLACRLYDTKDEDRARAGVRRHQRRYTGPGGSVLGPHVRGFPDSDRCRGKQLRHVRLDQLR